MATTPTYGLNLPVVGGSEDTWGTQINTNTSKIEDLLDGTIVLDGGPAIDTTFTIVDSVDNTKVIDLDLSGNTTGTTRTITVLDEDLTLVGTTNTQTLTNKTIDPASNTIDGDVLDIDFTPSNYTPDSSTPAEASDDDDLTAHLQGIDTKLGTLGDPSSAVFLASSDASNDATLDFTAFDGSTYDSYIFVLSNLIPATDGVGFYIRTSADSGSTWDSSNYASPPLDGGTASGGESQIEVVDPASGIGSAAGEGGLSAIVQMPGPHLSQSTYMIVTYVYTTDSGVFDAGGIGGVKSDAEAVDGIRFYFSSGNIESGTITMYGLKNAT